MSTALRQIWKHMIEVGYGKSLNKVRIISVGNGKCTAELTVEEEHSNGQGSLHGGCSATIIDCVSTLALASHKRAALGVSVDMHITYLKAVLVGEEVVIESETQKAGKTLAFLDVLIKKKGSCEIVAKGSHTKFIGGS